MKRLWFMLTGVMAASSATWLDRDTDLPGDVEIRCQFIFLVEIREIRCQFIFLAR